MICSKCKKDIPDGSAYCCWCGKVQGRIAKPKTRRPNGEGCVWRFSGSKTWTARVTDMARSRYDEKTLKFYRKTHQKGGFPTEAAARAWCVEWYRNRTTKDAAPALHHYWDLYESGEMQLISKSKQSAYRTAWKKMASIHGKAVDAISISDLRSVVAENATSHYTARDMKVLLSHLFLLASADGYANKDLPGYIVLPKLEETEKEVFTADEQAKMWSAFDNGDVSAAWPLLMIYTGMMPGETIDMTIDMVDLQKRTISGAGKKTSVRKAADVLFPEILVPVLEAAIDGRTEGKVFRRNKDNLYKDYHELTKRIGIRDLDPYCCRHTMATAMAIDKRIAPETLRKVMRWSANSQMSSRYVHPDTADIREAVETKRPI